MHGRAPELAPIEGVQSYRWGRMVLEVLPPIHATKGTAVRHLLASHGLGRALYAGDDTTDLDGFAAYDHQPCFRILKQTVLAKQLQLLWCAIESVDTLPMQPVDHGHRVPANRFRHQHQRIAIQALTQVLHRCIEIDGGVAPYSSLRWQACVNNLSQAAPEIDH